MPRYMEGVSQLPRTAARLQSEMVAAGDRSFRPGLDYLSVMGGFYFAGESRGIRAQEAFEKQALASLLSQENPDW